MKVRFDSVIEDDDGKGMLWMAGLQEVVDALVLAGVKPQHAENMLPGVNALRVEKDARSEPLTYARVARECLKRPNPDLDLEQTCCNGGLSIRIRSAGDESVEVSDEEAKAIQTAVKKFDGRPIVAHRFKELFAQAVVDGKRAEEAARARADDKAAKAAA